MNSTNDCDDLALTALLHAALSDLYDFIDALFLPGFAEQVLEPLRTDEFIDGLLTAAREARQREGVGPSTRSDPTALQTRLPNAGTADSIPSSVDEDRE